MFDLNLFVSIFLINGWFSGSSSDIIEDGNEKKSTRKLKRKKTSKIDIDGSDMNEKKRKGKKRKKK
jgi:hypothetical protein